MAIFIFVDILCRPEFVFSELPELYADVQAWHGEQLELANTITTYPQDRKTTSHYATLSKRWS